MTRFMPTRSFIVSRKQAGQTLGDLLRRQLQVSLSEVRRLVRKRGVRINGRPCLDVERRVTAGLKIEVLIPAARPQKGRAGQPVPRFVDNYIVVVDKPAGLTTMRHAHEAAEFGARGRRFLPPTLADLLPDLLAGDKPGSRPRVRAVHRLDKDTSGLVVFARTAAAESHLGKQFRGHTIARTYLAVVRGQAKQGRIESFLVGDRGDGRRGSTRQSDVGKRTVTHVQVVERLGDFTLVECRLETGRTHQVRIHLAEAGTPLCGEKVYDRPLHGAPVPDRSGAKRIALHAATLAFDHPVTGKRCSWQSALPPDLKALLESLRRQSG
jgi:23S rRNA pseudouridine1911/1915/1917 synthase